jgi:predicted NBD/HSP70 family sugar kinase
MYINSVIDTRQRQMFRVLWSEGRLSRSELHERTGLTPNGVGLLAEAMLRDGLLRECPAATARAGRPRVPLEIDPSRRHVIGLSLVPGRVEVCRLGLSGTLVERIFAKNCPDPSKLIQTAATLLRRHKNGQTLGVGVSVTGFVDPTERTILFSSALGGGPAADLAPVYEASNGTPIVLENDMHALAARWLLTHRADHNQDVLLVWINDGRLGAAMLINGRPNRGCATGGNELGHTRFFVDTERCYCGHSGCLERIVSSQFLARRNANHKRSRGAQADLLRRAAAFERIGDDAAMDEVTQLLACGLANVVNFVRPHRLVLVSPFMRFPAYGNTLIRLTRGMVLPQLVDRVHVDLWDQAGGGSAETAAWLAMAELLHGGWNQVHDPAPVEVG